MGRYIVKIQDYYFEWSTVTDSPVTFGMAKDEFWEYYQAEYGRHGSRDFVERIERADKFGSSAHLEHDRPPYLWGGNRAGPDEDELTADEIYQAYCLRQPIRGGWLVPAG